MYNTATIQLTFTLHMLQMYAVKLKEKCNILNLKDFWKHSNLLILFCIFIVGVYRCIHSFYIYFTVNISILVLNKILMQKNWEKTEIQCECVKLLLFFGRARCFRCFKKGYYCRMDKLETTQ